MRGGACVASHSEHSQELDKAAGEGNNLPLQISLPRRSRGPTDKNAIIILLLSISFSLFKENKRVNETDYHKLLRLSHPRNFMKPYDKDKVGKANCIYNEVEQIKEDDFSPIIL